ncbi:dihydropteroate synthase [Shewanella sedimentimangrovi]|uniref:Dihydropteroate synthase n=1 Tax=Shewanella sedimentimangrovi TaxID=2814293 RepID=A0ABX7R5L5_9GAMM|nr:dihydropteroate synthase [Shewanella sedimentimangrovi]QSX38108.1 dihydropteroate synthase [Shewanella sedimentimangrovi]
MYQLRAAGLTLTLDRPRVMGIVNVTPDSFSDGGEFAAFDAACRHVDLLVAQEADIIDIGGESTRPGAAEVSVAEELRRVIPLVEYAARYPGLWISVDTSKPEVMRAAAKAGAHLLNDVRALTEPGALEAAAELGLPVCLMHMQGSPKTMQDSPHYQSLLDEVYSYLQGRVEACVQAGISRENIVLDPGFGFGKTLAHNYELLARFDAFSSLGLPLLAGLSRKSMLGNLLGREPKERLAGSLAGAMIAAQRGAHIIRVHDVAETVDVLKVLGACENFQSL